VAITGSPGAADVSLRSIVGVIVWLAVCFSAGVVGSRFTGPAVASWYAGIAKPSWTPPNSVFGPVWSALYLMMGLAAWLVWRKAGFSGAPGAMLLFGLQLVVNAAWSWIFFGLRRFDLGFLEIVVLWALILVTVIAFWRHDTRAALLLLPYLAWVSYAGALNFAIWRLNPDVR
jgi:tryptophan-rich sensory protein